NRMQVTLVPLDGCVAFVGHGPPAGEPRLCIAAWSLGTHRTVRARRRVAAWRFPSIPREPPARPQNRPFDRHDGPDSCLRVRKYPTVATRVVFSMHLQLRRGSG